jgi:hypothetical protein
MNDIISMFYCCIILHNMAVVEHVNSGTGKVESDAFYDCVGNDTVLEQSRLEAAAQEFQTLYISLNFTT